MAAPIEPADLSVKDLDAIRVLASPGNAWRDLAGRRLEFVNPAPKPGRLDSFAGRQTGVIGDCTASRKVKVPDIPMEQIGEYYAARKPFPWHWGNSLYFEWFSTTNGRVVIESASFQLTISPDIAWEMTSAEEETQRRANAEAMGNFMGKLGEAAARAGSLEAKSVPAEAEWCDNKPLTEEEAEKMQEESDRLVDRIQARLEREGPDADYAKILEEELERQVHKAGSPNAWNDDDIQTRFRYNQAFLSVNAMVPSVFMLMLCLIPAIMSAIAVVREKETGSIANFRSTPITKLEFLLGKQLPYAAVAMVSFVFLFLMAIFVFDVPIKGSFLTLLIGTVVYVVATTGFGQLISSFTRTQVAAVFATAILSIVPAVNFSGLFAPVSSLSGGAKILGLTFPSAWYQPVTVGVFAKALGMPDLWRNIAAIAIIALAYLILSLVLLRKQEA